MSLIVPSEALKSNDDSTPKIVQTVMEKRDASEDIFTTIPENWDSMKKIATLQVILGRYLFHRERMLNPFKYAFK